MAEKRNTMTVAQCLASALKRHGVEFIFGQSIPTALHLAAGDIGLAKVDGASGLQVLTRIVLPLARPGFLVVALTTALFAWNEFYFALTFMQDDDMQPVTAGFLSFKTEYATNWGLTSAAGLIMVAPIVILFLVLQRQFIAGLTAGGVKS